MRLARILATVFCAALMAETAFADDSDRYVMEKSDSGFVRMDRQTGEMSVCEERAGQLVCKLAAEERAAFQDEIDRLQGAMKALDGRVVALENSLAAKFEQTLPTEEQFEKTMNYMERFLRGFMGIVKDMEKQADDPAKLSQPQKT